MTGDSAMERLEMAELLSKKAGVDLAEARDVLAENDWDILDAMVVLDRRDRALRETPADTVAEAGNPVPAAGKAAPEREPLFTNGFAVLWKYIKKLAKISVETSFIVLRKGKTVFSVPVLVPAFLLLSCFWLTLPVLLIGLFLGFQYHIEGRRGAAAVNRAMDKLGGVVENLRDNLDNGDGD